MHRIPTLAALAATLALAACAMPGANPPPAAAKASAMLLPTQGSQASGAATFQAVPQGLSVHVHVTGVAPNSEHGFHLHEKGDCSAPDGTSAGGHFNPSGSPHGPQDGPHHAGDMPALKADAQGVVDASFTLGGVGIGAGAGANDIVKRAVILHAAPDDYRTQPTGNSGARIACGVVEAG